MSAAPGLSALPFELPAPLEAALRAAYADPPRAYHGFGHVLEVLEVFASVPAGAHAPGESWARPKEVVAAILFHDVIYEAGRSDNEARSAALARAWLDEHLPELGLDLDRVEALVLLTARHGHLDPAEVDPEAALFLDCDMAILGAEPARYRDYEAAIREEYRAVPDALYREGRGRFLGGLLARERIYLSDRFHARLDARARKNLREALVALGTSDVLPR